MDPMNSMDFNPFEDRLSRDIRNEMSEAFAVAIESGDRTRLDTTFNDYDGRAIDSVYKTYLHERMSSYEQALAQIQPDVLDPISRGVILWDLSLFFEVHEILEHAWYDAAGELKLILQALIRSAGVYIKLEYGFDKAARNIAAKALPVLTKNRHGLKNYFDPEKLISSLKDLKSGPPRLGAN
jgi:hypothetical protein